MFEVTQYKIERLTQTREVFLHFSPKWGHVNVKQNVWVRPYNGAATSAPRETAAAQHTESVPQFLARTKRKKTKQKPPQTIPSNAMVLHESAADGWNDITNFDPQDQVHISVQSPIEPPKRTHNPYIWS